jgi:hypothetical protein
MTTAVEISRNRNIVPSAADLRVDILERLALELGVADIERVPDVLCHRLEVVTGAMSFVDLLANDQIVDPPADILARLADATAIFRDALQTARTLCCAAGALKSALEQSR